MPDCPVTLNHTDGPSGYLAWHEWAEEMSRTHRQKKCRSCGLYKIWEPKVSGPRVSSATARPANSTVGPDSS